MHYLVGVLLAALTLVAFAQVLGYDFINIYDDNEYITHNAVVRGGLTKAGVIWAFNGWRLANWHPLTLLSHMLDVQVYRLNPRGHHLTNLLFHVANVLLLFWVLVLMTKSLGRSAFVAALFAIHPLHVESVAWISERKDVLSTFFWLLTMLAYVRYTKHPNIARYLPVVLFFALGLMSKPMLVTLPIVLLLMDYWPLRRLAFAQPRHSTLNTQQSTLNRLILEKSPLFALAAASCALTLIAQRSGGALGALKHYPIEVRIGNALVAYVSYIGKMIWPRGLVVIYPHPGDSLPAWQALSAGALLVGLSVLIFRAGRSRPYLTIGWLWYLITLVPVVGFVQVGVQAMADRYTYVALIGLFVAIAWGVPDLLTRDVEARKPARHAPREPDRATALAALSVLTIVALTTCTWFQVKHWKNGIALFEHALEFTSKNYIAHSGLGIAFANQGRTDEAIAHLREALLIDPTYDKAHNNLGLALAKQGKLEEAIAHYETAMRINPNDPDPHNNLGNAYSDMRMYDRAIAQYNEALRISPENKKTHYNMGNALSCQGKFDDAIDEYNKALRIQPDSTDTMNNLGMVLARIGKFEEAKPYFLKALRIDPKQPKPHYNMGVVLMQQKRLDEAISEYRKATQIQPDYCMARYNLAACFFSKGQYTEAWREVRECRKYRWQVDPGFINALSAKMPEPRE